jgi:hypothetical protein
MKPAELHALYEAVLSRGGMLLINTLIPGNPLSTYVKISIPGESGMVSRATYEVDPTPRNWGAEIDLLRANYASTLDPIVVVQPQSGDLFLAKLQQLVAVGAVVPPVRLQQVIDEVAAETPAVSGVASQRVK